MVEINNCIFINKNNMENLEKLTKELAIEKLQYIKQIIHDNEVAHIEEDNLWEHFIQCVAAKMYNIKEAVEIANIIKTTSDIEFERWYA